MAQLQSSVHTLYRWSLTSLFLANLNTFYSVKYWPVLLCSGVCEEGETSAADILALLARALEGYVPMLAMLRSSQIMMFMLFIYISQHGHISGRAERNYWGSSKGRGKLRNIFQHSDPLNCALQLLIKHMQDDISGVEKRSGSRLPGVECGASFSDMSAGINPHSCLIFPLFCLFFFRRKHVHPQFVLTLFCPLRLD